MEQEKKCKRNGCQKRYKESENGEQVCNFHPGKPIFHDLKKGWTCCNKIVYDWDEFQGIPTCATGSHTDVDPNADATGQDQFFKSDTVTNASRAQDKHEQKVQIKSISGYNKQVEEQKQQEQAKQPVKELKPVIDKDGKYKCVHKGCQKAYAPDSEDECKFHPGEPVFHDLKKYWTCCKKETWDWDDFMKLPTCASGQHVPKMA